MEGHSGIDARIAGLGEGGVVLALVAALLLGLRHATDPDHVTAVSTLVFSGRAGVRRLAARLGLAWGLGHATTLILLGLPVVLVGEWLPEIVGRVAEFVIGVLIVALAVRLLVRWRRGYLHVHVHEHDGVRHAHPHMHEPAGDTPHPALPAHRHGHARAIGRSPLEAYAIGLVHGVGGSAGAGLLLVAAAPTTSVRVASLLVFALGTAISMALMSALVGFGLASGWLGHRLERLVPAVGVASGLFGIWYAAGAF
jgi:cytochrome c biogenesis protein CcdA